MTSWAAGLAVWVVCFAGTPALAQDGARTAVVAPGAQGEVTLVKKATKRSGERSSSSKPLKGDLGWVVAGSVGALVPLVLFALPMIWLAWIPGAPFFLVVAALWAGLMTFAGGVVAWLLLALLSPTRSGFLIPTLVSGAVGMGTTFLAALAASLVLFTGWGASSFLGYWGWPGATPPWIFASPFYFLGAGVWWVATVIAFAVWLTGCVVASIAGPMLGAYLYHRLGVPGDGELHVDPVTPR